MANAEAPSPGSKADAVMLLVQEMLIDAFGIVIPGFCFIVLAATSLGLPLIDFAKELGPAEHLRGLRPFVSENSAFVLISLLLFSFVAGHILYRQDPKRPDKYSIWWRWKHVSKSGCVREWGNEREQFPYSHLNEYLKDRNFVDLAKFITWSGADFEKSGNARKQRRSKHFINRIKLRIKMKDSRLYFDILRNEAHIRLASSVWYGAAALCFFSSTGIGLGILANYYAKGTTWHVEAILVPCVVLVLAILTLFSIILSLHYQRVREIVYVLETAHILGLSPDPEDP